MTLKVLKLEYWQSRPELFCGDDLKSIEPVFNRNGYYFDTRTKQCWFEVDGDAFDMGSPGQFIFELKVQNHRPLTSKERNAISVLISNKLASKKLKEILYMDDLIQEIRENKYGVLKLKRKFLTKIKGRRNGKPII